MARRSRQESSTDIYHIMIRGINKEAVFKKEKDVRKIYHTLKAYLSETIEIYAYCIMPNHLHLLVKGKMEELSEYMKRVGASYAKYYNLERERCGYVFQGRFRSECVEGERYFWTCLRYIHNNPVKARLAAPGEPYLGCSTWEYQSGKIFLLHEKAFMLRKKNMDIFDAADAGIYRIVMDVKEDEDEQKEAYFAEKLQWFLEQEQISERTLFTSSKLQKKFENYISDEKIISKSMIQRKLHIHCSLWLQEKI